MYYLLTVVKSALFSVCVAAIAANGMAAVYSPGDVIASWSAGPDNFIGRFDPATGADSVLLQGGSLAVDFEFDPDGNLLWVNRDGLWRMNRDTGATTTSFSTHGRLLWT
jgi:hypothetical protein